jgi:16S rRNA (guanine966-N2)-methyltransferase
MRVVAGTARGRKLQAPPGRDVRPTGDRVREAVFNALGSLGVIEGATFLDLFAGTGALGIEALSRGAATVTFVERERAVADVVARNLASLDLGERATVVQADALRWLDGTRDDFDVALLDPPYAFDGWPSLLGRVPADLVVIESDRTIAPGEGWDVLREKRYGDTVVVIARRRTEPSS